MSRAFGPDISKPLPTGRTLAGTVLRWIFILAVVLVTISGIGARLAHAEGAHALAQECANSLARRNHLDHQGFGNRGLRCVDPHGRCSRGSRAENVGYGCADEACQLAHWRRSKGHAYNMTLGPITLAHADSTSGRRPRRYWCGVVPG